MDNQPTQPPQEPRLQQPAPPEDKSLHYIVPTASTSGLAIATGYIGLLSILILPGPFALVLGIITLRKLRQHPEQNGKGRAWTAIVLGGLASGVIAAYIVGALINQHK